MLLYTTSCASAQSKAAAWEILGFSPSAGRLIGWPSRRSVSVSLVSPFSYSGSKAVLSPSHLQHKDQTHVEGATWRKCPHISPYAVCEDVTSERGNYKTWTSAGQFTSFSFLLRVAHVQYGLGTWVKMFTRWSKHQLPCRSSVGGCLTARWIKLNMRIHFSLCWYLIITNE